MMDNTTKATLANGCFWCADGVFSKVEGILSIKSGYTGGKIKNPAYREVCSGRTGHAEAVQITYNPDKISYREILMIFFTTHDPTSLNKQGYDMGTQYRSVIFYHNPSQKAVAEEVISSLNQAVYKGQIVTKIEPLQPFYEAEGVHQDFYNQHRDFPYCRIIIDPKIQKLRQHFSEKMKDHIH